MAALELYEPINVPKAIADGLWRVDGPLIGMDYFGFKLPFTTRMLVARLAGGGLWLWSPIEPDPALLARIDALGPVAHLLAPNKIHYAHIAAWKKRYPAATAWAAPGVRERARSQGIEVAIDAEIGDAPPDAWAAELGQLLFRGSRFMEEAVFLHRPSRTLILADLIENFERAKVNNRLLRGLMKLGGVLEPGQTPRDLQQSWRGRKALARQSLERVLAWRPERIVMAHGRCIEQDAEQALRRAFRWLD